MTNTSDSRNTPLSPKLPELVVATHNPGKLDEFRVLLGPYVGVVTSAGELGLPEPEETGLTFTDNALIKARAAADATQRLALADDSGLVVEALGGEPGIYSARWAGAGKNFDAAMQRINDAIGTNPNRNASFIAVLALVWPSGRQEVFEGRIDGLYVWPPRGTMGHGYDPAFQPETGTETFAEMDTLRKNRVSHRGRAAEKLIAWLKTKS